jgi:predicted hydrolase (HD superfamily)
LLKRLYVALRQGSDTSDILDDIAEHNKEHGSKGTVALITYDTILRSMKQHVRTSAKMHNGVTLSPVMRAYAQDMQEELEYQPWYMNN